MRKATENSSESQRKECKLFPINLIWRKKNFCLINGFIRADAAAKRVWVGPRESNFLIFLKVIDGENRHRMHFAGWISGRRNRTDGRRYTTSPLWPVENFSIGGMFIAYLSTFLCASSCLLFLRLEGLSPSLWQFAAVAVHYSRRCVHCFALTQQKTKEWQKMNGRQSAAWRY